MPKVQSMWRLLGYVWRFLRQHRSIAWAAGISVVVLLASCPFGVGSLGTSVNLAQLSFQTHGGAAFLTPTPTPAPTQPGSSG
ncbi:MAG TPA: hypothetical protein VF099_00330, partial [Ktedonobacterales bacterium]